MVKLQIGENLINLTAKEEDLFFELLDKNYDIIRNSPTFNAIYNWMKEDHDLSKETVEYLRKIPTVKIGDNHIPCMTIPKSNKKTVEDPWNHNTTTEEKTKVHGEKWKKQHKTDDYTRLSKMIDELLKAQDEKEYYLAL